VHGRSGRSGAGELKEWSDFAGSSGRPSTRHFRDSRWTTAHLDSRGAPGTSDSGESGCIAQRCIPLLTKGAVYMISTVIAWVEEFFFRAA
jgi:hypothetical protein